jgi:hypothetical protein
MERAVRGSPARQGFSRIGSEVCTEVCTKVCTKVDTDQEDLWTRGAASVAIRAGVEKLQLAGSGKQALPRGWQRSGLLRDPVGG